LSTATGILTAALAYTRLESLVTLHGSGASDKISHILEVGPNKTTSVIAKKTSSCTKLTRCCSQRAQLLARTRSAAARAPPGAPQRAGGPTRSLTERSAAKNPGRCVPACGVAELSPGGLLEADRSRDGDHKS
jgi:hypothetical protein